MVQDHRLSEVTDIEAVPLHGDPRSAVKIAPDQVEETLTMDILICGGGLGGVAAALAAAESGARVCLLEETGWLGGQATSQGVSALDEHQWIESFGGTKSYDDFREAIRRHYAVEMSEGGASARPLNPGKCWVSSLAFEPRIAVRIIDEMLGPFCTNGQLRILRRTKVYGCRLKGKRLESVDAMNLETGLGLRLQAQIVIDATEMGDLLPLAGFPCRVGAESRSETDEPHAPEHPSRTSVQGCTYPFVLEKTPSGAVQNEAPPGYVRFRKEQPYSLKINIHSEDTRWLQYAMFEQLPGTPGSVWEYRRLIAGEQFLDARNDISMFNWPGNDFAEESLLDLDAGELAVALQQAKLLSLGFAHWVQTKPPPPEGGSLRLRRDVLGSMDGLSRFPYIREARRIVPLRTMIEQDVRTNLNPGVRGRTYEDAVGVGHYALDVHHTCDGAPGYFVATNPFQIALGALIPTDADNYIAGGKNLGVTHITNGCYRLHPVEWNVGEVAGLLGAFAIENSRLPGQVWAERTLLRRFQARCLQRGIPCSWLTDIPPTHPQFFAIHFLVLLGGPPSEKSLRFDPKSLMTPELIARWTAAVTAEYPDFVAPSLSGERESFATAVSQHLKRFLF